MIAHQLYDNHKIIHRLNRAQLINDAFALIKKGKNLNNLFTTRKNHLNCLAITNFILSDLIFKIL